MLASEYIYRAFRRCGQIRPGYVPSPELLQDGFQEFLSMYDGWNAERTLNYSVPDYTYPITGAGSQTSGCGFQIGPTAADWVGPRPEAIIRMNMLLTTAPNIARIPIAPISVEQWAAIPTLTIPGTSVATVYYYDPQWPNGVINLWPPVIGNSVEIFTWGVLTPPSDLQADYTAPPGYDDAISWTLAERLWGFCTKQNMSRSFPLPWIAGKAELARQKIKRVNAPMPRLNCDFRGGNGAVGVADWPLLYTGRLS